MNIILITGSTKGIGLIFALGLSKNNKVIIHGRDEKIINNLKAKIKNPNIIFICKDLINYKKIADDIIEKYGIIDILINNAAIVQGENVIETNVNIPYNLSKYCISKNTTRIINISSNSALQFEKNNIEYCLSKNMLESMTRALAINFPNCIISCLRIDDAFKTSMTKKYYKTEQYATLKDPQELLKSILFLIKLGKESSGRIYCNSGIQKNILLEKNFNNIYTTNKIIEPNPYEEEFTKDVHICNGENVFNKDGKYAKNSEIYELQKKISTQLNCEIENINIVSGGISGCFDLLCNHFVSTGCDVICHTLSLLPLLNSVEKRGGNIKFVQPQLEGLNINYNCEKILEQINPNTRMIYIIHPTYLFADSIVNFENFVKQVPSNIPIILDECYIEYLIKITDSIALMNKYFVFGMRTFSKIYGLASYRIGYITCNKKYSTTLNLAHFTKSIPKYCIQKICEFLESNKFENIKNEYILEKQYVVQQLKQLNRYHAGNSLFLIVYVNDVQKAIAELRQNNIIIFNIEIIPSTILYQIGKRKYNEIFINIIKKYN